MSDPWIAIGSVVGGGGTLALVAALIVYVTKGAIAKAVTLAGDQELARLKGALDAQNTRLKGDLDAALERGRQEFSRDLERDRQAAARTLERYKSALAQDVERERQGTARALEEFKAQLTLDAEVRRQAAARKVEALQTIVGIIDGEATMIQRTLSGDERGIPALNEYWAAVRRSMGFQDIAVLRASLVARLEHQGRGADDSKMNLSGRWGAPPSINFPEEVID